MAATIGWTSAAWADDEFTDCGQIGHSIASPFVQGRTQLSILNLNSTEAPICNLVEFRIAEVVKPPEIIKKDDVESRWWKENWGVYRCGEPVVYDVWYYEIGLGGVTFKAEPNKSPSPTFLDRLVTGKAEPLSPELMVTAKEEPAGGELSEEDLLVIARAAIAGKEVAKQIAAKEPTPEPATEAPPTEARPARRILEFKSPNFKGHDVCAVQRALIAEGLSVSVDGAYGPGMKKAVAKFQKKHGLKGTGVVTEKTRLVLAYGEAPQEDNSQPNGADDDAKQVKKSE
ncbi:MAG: peptidoglycan-binding protein [Alphaproteobacteria bacterium]|nr:peptidoglycan-binding protein [Alphaproteobacteria bacterium]